MLFVAYDIENNPNPPNLVKTISSQLKSLVLFFFALLLISSCTEDPVNETEDPPTEENTPPEQGNNPTEQEDLAPLFTLTSVTDTSVSLSAFENKVVVLFFFGNSCPTCLSAGPKIEEMLATPFSSNSDYAILGLDQWNGNKASVQAFKTSTGISFPLLLNASAVAADYKTTYDRIIVLNKSREVAFMGTKAAGNDIAAAKAKVTELVSN